MKLTTLIILASATLSASASTSWTLNESIDPLTDVKTYDLSTLADPINVSGLTYKPQLHVRITPVSVDKKADKLFYKPEVFFYVAPEGLRRGASSVALRFDKNEAFKTTATASTDRRAGFLESPSTFIDSSKSATNVVIQYTTSLGAIRTPKFNVLGINSEIQKIKRIELNSSKQ